MRRVVCLYCNRMVATHGNRWGKHSVTPGAFDRCPLSFRPIPYPGDSHREFRGRALLVGELAAQLRDEDPWMLQVYLTSLPAEELQRLLVVALAAVDVDKPISELFDWVTDLTSESDAA